MSRLARKKKACKGILSRLQMSLGVAFVLVLHGACRTMATAADKMGDERSELTGDFPLSY